MSEEKEAIEVFEYDPGEEDGKAEPKKKNAEEIKIVYAKPTLAFETFNQKLFSPPIEDEKASKNLQFVEASNVPSDSSKKFESPHERIQRIKREIGSFTKHLDSLAHTDAIKEITSGSILVDIENLEVDFGSILNDTRIAPYLPNDCPFPKSILNPPDSQVATTIISQIGSLGGKGSSGVSYELLHRSKAGDKELRLNEVDRRVTALEKKVGTVTKKTGFKDMHTALGDLYHKLELLQGSNIDSLTRRIASMNAELQLQQHLLRIKGAKGGEKLINELYGLMQKGNKPIKELGNIVMGLQSQDVRHTRQTASVLRLQKLQRTQAGLTSILNEDNEALEKLAANMTDNVKILKSNIENFQRRFASLEKKIKQL